MIDAYAIGATLTLNDQIFSQLQQVYDKFDVVDQAVQRINSKLQDTAGLIGQASSGANSLAAAFDRAAAAAERMQRASSGIGGVGASGGSGGGGMPVPMIDGGGRPALTYSGGAGNQLTTIPGQDRSSSGRESWGHVPIGGYGGGGTPPGGDGGGYGGPPNWSYGNDDGGGRDASMRSMYPGGQNGRGHGAMGTHDYAALMFGGGIAAEGAKSYIESTFDAAAEIAKTRALMIGRGASPTLADQAVAYARKIQQNSPGVSFDGAMQMELDAYSITGNLGTAMKVAQPFATAGFVLHEYGKDDVAAGLYDTVRSGEIRGLLNSKNPDGTMSLGPLQNYINTMVTAGIVSGGKVTPATAMGIMTNASAMGIVMDQQALETSLILSQSLKGNQVGTGLNALGMQFLGGKMSQANARVLHEEDILPDFMFAPHDGKILKQYRTGIGQVMIPPGALKGQDEFAANPYGWIDDVLLPGIEKKYGKTLPDIMTGVYQSTSRIPGGRLIAEDILQHALIERQLGFYGKMGTPDAVAGKLRANDPTVQAAAFGNALVGLEAALGNAAMPQAVSMLEKLTRGLNDFANWQGKHPHASEAITDTALGVGGLGALGLGIGAVGLALHPLMKVGRYAYRTGSRAFGAAADSGLAADTVSGLEIGGAAGAETGPGALITALAGAIAAALYSTGAAQPGAVRGRQLPHGPAGSRSDPLVVLVANGASIADGITAHQARDSGLMPSAPTGYNLNGGAPPAPGQPFGPR